MTDFALLDAAEDLKAGLLHGCATPKLDVYVGNPFRGLDLPGNGPKAMAHDGPVLSVAFDEYIIPVQFCPVCGVDLTLAAAAAR